MAEQRGAAVSGTVGEGAEAGTPALLLMAFGGPASLDDVGPFMRRLMGGEPPPTLLAEAKRRYRLVGGGSPLPRMVGELGQAVRAALGGDVQVYVAMRYSKPFIADAVARMVAEGHQRFVAISLSPQYSAVSGGAYEEALLKAAHAGGAGDFILVESWHTREGFLEALADRLIEAQEVLGERGRGWPVVFTAHSLPSSDAALERYRREVGETVDALTDRVGARHWRLAYQSIGRGRPGEQWLGPALGEVMGELAREGADGVLVAPVGFVTEHMETLYDLDVEARHQALELGLDFARVPAVGSHQAFVATLAEMTRDYIQELERKGK